MDQAKPETPTVFRLSNRQVIELKGKDSLDYLQRIGTADFKSIRAGEAQHTLFLGRDGRIQAECIIVCHNTTEYFLIVPEISLSNLLEVLELYHFAEELDFVVNSDRHAYMILSASEVPVTLGQEYIQGNGKWGTYPASFIVTDKELSPGELGLAVGSDHELLDMRISQLIPEAGCEIESGKTIPLEVNLKPSISFTKGCYPGQEIIARIHNLGHPANILVRVNVGSDESPGQGFSLYADSKPIGRITSIGRALEHNVYDCLAIVKWAWRDKGTVLQLDEISTDRQAVVTENGAGGSV